LSKNPCHRRDNIAWHGDCWTSGRLCRRSDRKQFHAEAISPRLVRRARLQRKAWRFEWAGGTAVHWLKSDLFVDLARSAHTATRTMPT